MHFDSGYHIIIEVEEGYAGEGSVQWIITKLSHLDDHPKTWNDHPIMKLGGHMTTHEIYVISCPAVEKMLEIRGYEFWLGAPNLQENSRGP